MLYPELVRALLAYLISHTGRLDEEKRARLLERIGLEWLALEELTYEALEGTHLSWREILELTRRGRAKGGLFRFSGGFAEPAAIGHESHPPLPVLEEYLNGGLEDRPLPLNQDSLESLIAVKDWGLAEVSLHLATCKRCAARAAELRAAELVRSQGLSEGKASREHKPGARAKGKVLLRRRLAYQLLAPVGIALLVIFINLIFYHGSLFLRPGPAALPGPGPSPSEESQVVVPEEWEGFPDEFIPLGTRPSVPWPR